MPGIKKLVLAILFGILVSGGVYLISQTVGYRPFRQLQNSIDDSHFGFWKKHSPASDGIVIVDIDDASLEALGNFKHWPRRHFGAVINRVNADGARLVFLDIILMQGGSRLDNLSLVAAVRSAGNVLLGYYFTLDSHNKRKRPTDPVYNDRFAEEWLGVPVSVRNEFIRAKGVTLPYTGLVQSPENMGFTNYIPDPDGILRHIPLLIGWNHTLYPSASLQMWLQLKGLKFPNARISRQGMHLGDTFIPTDKHCFMRLNFRSSGYLHPSMSFRDVLDGKFPRGTFRNKVVMIGASSARLGDLKTVPGRESIPGVEVHAAALSTLLGGQFMTVISGNTILLLTIFCGVLISLIFSFFPTLTVGVPAALATPLFLYAYSVYCFIFHSELVNISVPSAVALLIALAMTVHHVLDHFERNRIPEDEDES